MNNTNINNINNINNNKVVLGIENEQCWLDLLKNKRVGLITNPTGINSKFESSIDILNKKCNLVALFSPEHGVRGSLQAGVHVDSYVDEITGINVISLYGSNKRPGKEIMDQIDVMCIDIQDSGSRYYTFIYTMAYAMMACADFDKEFVVFDRPNPINGTLVQGNILNTEKYRSFVGYYNIPQRHGMTIGELAELFNSEFGINCKLHVIPMLGWKREMDFEDTMLPWVVPTPNLPTINTAYAYNCTCIFEGTNLAEGRGTTTPFEIIGAPYLKSETFADELNSYNLPGVHFRPQWFTPTFSKYKDELCGGVFVHVTNRKLFNAVKTSFIVLKHLRDNYKEFEINKPYTEGRPSFFALEAGDDDFIYNKLTNEEICERIDTRSSEFIKLREKYLLY